MTSTRTMPVPVRQAWTVVVCAVLTPAISPADNDRSPAITAEDLRPHIEFLASPELEGRTGRGKAQAREYLVRWFQEQKLQPFFGESYRQAIPRPATEEAPAAVLGYNVGACVVGTDPVLKHEWIVVNAHYDHLGVRNGEIYHGADDNASGTAMLLEVARNVVRSPGRRSIAFVAFDLEESMLWGSRWFVAQPPVPREQIKLCLTADMIGRSLGGLDLPTVFVLGGEHSPQLRQILNDVPVPDGLELAQLGTDLIGTRSDYGPFRDERIPFLFFSTGEHPDYHKPTDTADRIDYPKAARISTVIQALLMRAANDDEAPQWSDREPQNLAEAAAVHRVAGHLLKAHDDGRRELTNMQRFFVSQVHSKTRFLVEKEQVTDDERGWLVRAAQLLMLSVF